jgi:hypothetical protein
MAESNASGLKNILMSFGATEEESEQAIRDVTEIINQKFAARFLNKSEQEVEALLKSAPESETEAYRKIAKEVWMDYFRTIQS